MGKRILLLSGLFLLPAILHAQEQQGTPTLKVIIREQVEGEDTPTIPVEKKGRKPKTETTVKEQELQRGAGLGGSNVFKAIELTPSLNVQTDDAYGLGGGSIRLRGFDSTQIGVSIDNMPLNDSGNFALYPHEYADVENLETVTIERGAVSKKSPFYTEIGGSIRIRTKPPANKFGIEIFPKYGTNDFKRIFFRVDTGKLPFNLKAFTSYSHTEADKWKGPGKYPEYRDHYTVGIQQNLGRVFWEFYYDKNVQLNYFYRPLSYQQAQDLDNFRRFDYTPSLIFPGGNGLIHNNPNIRDNNLNYYKFYKNPYTNQQLRANIEVDILDNLKLSLKPYMWIGRGSGTSATTFRVGNNWYIAYRESYNYTDRPGFTADLSFNTSFGNLTLGYWYERADLKRWQPSFPVKVNPDGSFELITNTSGTPSFRYNYIEKTITTTNTPYLIYEKEDLFNRVDINLGLRYAQVKRDYTNYRTTNLPYLPEDGIYDHPNLTKDPRLSYEKTYRKLLFNFGIGYSIAENIKAYFAFSQNFRVPPNFIGTVPNNLDAQFVVNQLKPEESNSYDLGVRFDLDKFYVVPSVYYVDYKNRLIRLADPNDPNVVYLRNAGKVRAYGFELETGANPMKNLSLYASYSYNVAEFRDDTATLGTTGTPITGIKGNQVPDTPKNMLKFGINYRLFGFNIKPSVQYISSRYGTVDNQQKIGGYTLVNLSVDRRITKNFRAYLDIVNLTDKKYIGRISPGEKDGRYYVGAPFTLSLGLKGRF